MSTFTYQYYVNFTCKAICGNNAERVLSNYKRKYLEYLDEKGDKDKEAFFNYTIGITQKNVTITCNRRIDPVKLRDLIFSEVRKETEIIAVPPEPLSDAREIPVGVRVNLKSSLTEYDYYIPVEDSFEDPDKVKRNCDTAIQTFSNRMWCAWVKYNSYGHRCRVIIAPGYDIEPGEVLRLLKVGKYHLADQARHIPNRDCLYHFRIKGLLRDKELSAQTTETKANLQADIKVEDCAPEPTIANVSAVLGALSTYVKHYSVNYSTSTVSIVANIEDAEINGFIDIINYQLEKKFPEKNVNLIPIAPSVQMARLPKSPPKQYFRRALFNVLFALGLMLLGAYIPLPLTLVGQFVGLCLGGMTLSMLWKTGGEFYQEAWNEFRDKRQFSMYTLIALGTGSAWVYSMILVLVPTLFPVAALSYQFLAVNMILGIINFGRGIRVRAEEATAHMVRSTAETYASNQNQYARVVRPGITNVEIAQSNFEQIYYKEVKQGDTILVEETEKFPVEGVIVAGRTSVEQSAITGETQSLKKVVGDRISDGSGNVSRAVLIRASSNGDNGNLTRTMRISMAKSSSPSICRLVDRIANIFVPSIIGLAVLTALGWLFLGPAPQLAFMIKSAMSVLLCACPCAMGLAVIPIEIGVNAMLKEKILVKDATAIETLTKVNTIVWDKTDTLTTPAIEEVFVKSKNYARATVIQLAASVERACFAGDSEHPVEHPIARAFIDSNFSNKFLSCYEPTVTDLGVSAIVKDNGKELKVMVGDLSYFKKAGITIDSPFIDAGKIYRQKAMTCTYVAVDGHCISVVGLKHTLRRGAKKSIKALRDMKIQMYILTGDNMETALQIANELKIEPHHVFAGQSPDDKVKRVQELQDVGRIIGFIGDGINDIPALEYADVSIALGAQTSAADNCDITLPTPDIGKAIIISRETMHNIHQNLYWTALYNIVSLTAAVCGMINPVIAPISMAFSSVGVMVNSCCLPSILEQKLKQHHNSKSQPVTWYDTLRNLFSFTKLFQLLEMFLTMVQEQQKAVRVIPNLVATFRYGQNDSPKKAAYAPAASPSPSPEPQVPRYKEHIRRTRQNSFGRSNPQICVNLAERFSRVTPSTPN